MQEPAGTDIQAEVAEFERKLERLRVTYEQYFMGIVKREPAVQLKDVVRVMRRLDQEQIKNTALRYRFRTLIQKFNTHRNYWNRTLRAIEAGTYHRDVARVRRKMIRKGIEMPDLSQMRKAGDVERALAKAAEQEHKPAEPRRSAADIRGRSADEVRKPAGLDGAPAGEWDNAIDKWEPNFGDFDDDTQPEVRLPQRSASPFADPPTGPLQPPPPPTDAYADAPPAASGLEDLAQMSRAAPPQRGPEARREGRAGPARARARPQGAPATPASRPSRSPPGGAPAAKPAPPSGMSRGQMDSLYRRFVRAKTMCGEDAGSVRYDALVKTIERQLPKIKQAHEGRDVDFQVVIRNGRAILKAKAK